MPVLDDLVPILTKTSADFDEAQCLFWMVQCWFSILRVPISSAHNNDFDEIECLFRVHNSRFVDSKCTYRLEHAVEKN